jgi:hypothetical protein
MKETPTDSSVKVRPVLVFRSKRARPEREAVERNPSALKQLDNVTQYAIDLGVAMEPSHVIVRTGAHYRPQHDRRLLRVFEHARKHLELLALDDVFRLIDFRDQAAALNDIRILHASKVPLFSVLHRQPLWRMSRELLVAQIGDGVREFRRQSESVKAGIARNRLPDEKPDRRAAERGALMKKRFADERAQRLIADIERIRSQLEPDRRSNLAAIATALNAADIATPSGRGKWQGITVKRVLDRAGRSLDA